MHRLGPAVILSAVLLSVAAATAAEYPSKPIRLVVPAPAGGPADRYARLVGSGMSEALRQPVIVDNRPGATGNVGAEVVAKSPRDGYTLLFGHNAIFSTNPHVLKDIPFSALDDFVAVAPVLKAPLYLFVPASSPARSVQEFAAFARKNPGSLNYGSSGIGGITHLAMEALKQQAGIGLMHIPYKGGTVDVIQALLGGDLAAAFEYYTPVMAQAKAGRLRVLGVTSLERNPAAPDIPTFAEQGVQGFEHYGWVGVFAPAGTPKPIIEKLNAEIARVRASPEIQRSMHDAGVVEMKGSPAEFAAFVRREYERGATLVKKAGATLE